MKVLFITTWYPSDKSPSAGIFIKEHAIAAQKTGADIYILNIQVRKSKSLFKLNIINFKDSSELKTLTIEIESAIYKLLYVSPLLLFTISFRIFKKRIQLQFQPDIIHSHVIFPAGIIGDKFAKKLNLPHVLSEHWTEIKVYLKKNIFSNNGLKAYKAADAILPVSSYLKDQLTQLITKDSNIYVVPNIVDQKLFHYLPKKLNPNKVKFLAIGHWHKSNPFHKRPDLLIMALAEVKKVINKEIELELIGNGNWIPELKELASKQNLNVVFSYQKDKNYIASCFTAVNFLLHASEKETFCVVIAEALKTGTPVVASNVGAIPELINTENGIVCNNNIIDWKEAIVNAINTQYNYEKIARMVEDKYNYSSVGKKLNEIYLKYNH